MDGTDARKRRSLGMVPWCVLALALVAPGAAVAAGPPASMARFERSAAPETVIQDDTVLLHGTDEQIATALQRITALGISRVRVTAGWSVLAPDPESPQRPAFDDTDPAAYPPAVWDNLDRIVTMAHAAGIGVMLDIAFWAPVWATHDPPGSSRPRAEIDPELYAHFAAAVARRYSGTWSPPAPLVPAPAAADPPPPAEQNVLTELLGGHPAPAPSPPLPAPVAAAPKPLPAVDTFTLWNEPNHPGFLTPQWGAEDGRAIARSADLYRAMVRAAYPAVKAVAPASRVLIGATSSGGGTDPRRSGVAPLVFLKRFACVDADWHPLRSGACAGFTTIPGDGWSHHPYSLHTLPDDPGHPGTLPVARTAELLGALHRLTAMKRLAPANQDLYLTEYGYETSPPDPEARFGPQRQAQLLSWAEFLGTRSARVRMWPQFELIDRPGGRAGPRMRLFGDWQTGLYYDDWSPKPAAAAFRTPTFARCIGPRRSRQVLVWSRIRDGVPGRGEVQVTAAGGDLRARMAAAPAAVPSRGELLRLVPYRAGWRYRVLWALPGARMLGPSVAPVGCGRR